MTLKLKYKILLLLILFFIPIIVASDGDRSPFYQKCISNCKKSNCTSDGAFSIESAKLQGIWDWLLLWNCDDECSYQCMWHTVQGYKERKYQIPKFHGKWPFRRILGVQEPASAFASILNFAVHFYMYQQIKSEFHRKDVPHVILWHYFAWVCMNAWIWSTIFHTRDSYFTEFMDYTCALAMVISLYIAAVMRIFYKRRKIVIAVLALTLLYYVEHARYLFSGRIDYDYNMIVNLFFGVLGSMLWLSWSCIQYTNGLRYLWRVGVFTILSGLSLSLELFDFPPVYGWDAHALWHLSTVPLPLLFYRFVIDDLRYLRTGFTSGAKSNLKLP